MNNGDKIRQTCIKLDIISMGTGNIIVLLFSADIPFRV